MGLACCGWKEGEAEVYSVCGRDGAVIRQEDVDSGVGGTFVVVGDVGVNEMTSGTCVSYSWGIRRGGGMIGGMQSDNFSG